MELPVRVCDDTFVLEVVDWLESAAQNIDLERIARQIRDRKPRYVLLNFSAHFSAGEITGIEYVVQHPIKDFQTNVGLTNHEMQLLREFVVTTPSNGIKINFEFSKDGEEFLCLSQLNYVPRGRTQIAIQELLDQIRKVFDVVDIPEDFVIKRQ